MSFLKDEIGQSIDRDPNVDLNVKELSINNKTYISKLTKNKEILLEIMTIV